MTRTRRYAIVLGGAAGVLAMAVAALGGAVGVGRAATTQQVSATLACEPTTVSPQTSTGCVLTVTNVGGNNVNNVTATVTAVGGTFLSSTDSACKISNDKLVLTCSIGKLTAALTAGAKFSETHELQMPATGSVTQTVAGRYSSATGNNRGSDDILVTAPNPLTTSLDGSNDFSGRFANQAADFVQTGDAISTNNRYSTRATLGTTGFAVGLTVKEVPAAPNDPNCPSTGCFGGPDAQVIQFHITPLPGSDFPASFTLTIKVLVPNGTQTGDLDVLHNGNPVPLCSSGQTDPVGDCISDRGISNGNPKVATIVITGPGTGNGGYGVG